MKLQWMTTLLLTSCISLAGYCGSGAAEMHSPIPLQQEIPPAPGYFNGRLWRLDASASSPFPSHFRTSASAFDLSLPHKLPLPSRKGLDRLRISGSAQPSGMAIPALARHLKHLASGGPVFLIDLRQESHGFFNGNAVSWYGNRNWANRNKTMEAVCQDEKERIQSACGTQVTVYSLNKEKEPVNAEKITVQSASTEETLAARAGLHYVHFPITDHTAPSEATIRQFISFMRSLPPDAWVHFHCEAGKGRTTTMMILWDIYNNPELPLETIVKRQHLIGGAQISLYPQEERKGSWKFNEFQSRARVIRMFYDTMHSQSASHADRAQ